jgi:Holliday junction resolvasome RuvABC endonuclease subunit
MPTKPPTILAIDPGTKEIGVAVLSGPELCYYAVKTIKCRRPPRAMLAEISTCVINLIEDYRPQTLAIEKTFLIQKSAALLNVAAAEMKQMARGRGLALYEYAPVEVRRLICQSEKATKRETALRIARQFPELARHLNQMTRWGELYWANMFDAVAVGIAHLNEIYGDEEAAFANKL